MGALVQLAEATSCMGPDALAGRAEWPLRSEANGHSGSGWNGVQRGDNPAALDDTTDMINAEVIKQLPIVRNLAYDEVRLLAGLQ